MIDESIDACDRIRKLASVQTVSNIARHPDADRLELATILGWQVVIAKGEVAEGAKVVYCEIDSKLPGSAEWLPSAVKTRVEKQKNAAWFHVKSACIRGQISQGLIVSIMDGMEEKEDGFDMTSILGIEKHEEPVFVAKVGGAGGGLKGDFPRHLVRKTDEPRIQSFPKMLAALQGERYYSTVKLDGSSGTFLIDRVSDEFWVCSRNNIRQKPTDGNTVCPYWEAALKSNMEAALREHNLTHLAIQGEVCGPKIAKNILALNDFEVFVFNLYDMKTKQRLPYEEFVSTCATLGLRTVPIESVGDVFEFDEVKSVLEAAKGEYKSGNIREGLVFRSLDHTRISFKAINNDYLLGKKKKSKPKAAKTPQGAVVTQPVDMPFTDEHVAEWGSCGAKPKIAGKPAPDQMAALKERKAKCLVLKKRLVAELDDPYWTEKRIEKELDRLVEEGDLGNK